MLVYAVRHGECWSNKEDLYAPREGNPLTEKGFEQARHTGELLKGIKFDKIYSSPLLRAKQTEETALPGREPIFDERLIECDYGELTLKSHKECFETLGPEFRKSFELRDYTSYGGESTHQQIVRTKSFMQSLENLDANSTIAVFCHAGTVMSMLSVALDCEFLFRRTSLENGSISIFEFSNGCWKLKRWGEI